MISKIPLDSPYWAALDPGPSPTVRELLAEFIKSPDASPESDLFASLCERLCESNTLYPPFYLAFPYLAEAAAGKPPKEAAELWAWIGAWFAEGNEEYQDNIPGEATAVYKQARADAEKAFFHFFLQYDFSDAPEDLHYLLAAPFGLARPDFAKAAALFDSEIELEAACPNGHIALYLIGQKGVCNSKKEKAPGLQTPYAHILNDIASLPLCPENPWLKLLEKCAAAKNDDEYRAAYAVCEKGIGEGTPLSAAVFLYAYLLKRLSSDKGDILFGDLCLNMAGDACCPQCGAVFRLLDGWGR